MKKIIKFVLILGILVFSMLNLVQAQDKYLCCPSTTQFDENSGICTGVTQIIVNGKLSPWGLPQNPKDASALWAVIDKDCNNIRHAKVVSSWKKVKTLSSESGGPVKTVSSTDCFLALEKSGGAFIDKKICDEDKTGYYDCKVRKTVGGEKIPVLCKNGFQFTPKIGPKKGASQQVIKETAQQEIGESKKPETIKESEEFEEDLARKMDEGSRTVLEWMEEFFAKRFEGDSLTEENIAKESESEIPLDRTLISESELFGYDPSGIEQKGPVKLLASKDKGGSLIEFPQDSKIGSQIMEESTATARDQLKGQFGEGKSSVRFKPYPTYWEYVITNTKKFFGVDTEDV